MQPLNEYRGSPSVGESWEEYAEHSLTHDDLYPCPRHEGCVVAPYSNSIIISVLAEAKGE